ncbi:hypothetical protein ZYGR_0I03180 [Zygosaccharomyces rouxii]|uniref:ZYRO0C07612p n=2 Tax=Zygosaccharomyces rouxii TaxID=4956 RepID=C5DTD4_ZYGRC|nr:uncharacterized protein ZYRO0C07612g [Zygosaccharomyces rouxii]KAH9201774.1 hemolysin-III related-domain-containing protein [Zygosaccharomyces rouxii]GAV48021.1 hypothetical protein ZYGR_0I03180 [Zygosaccharomyces rouxii]CAR27045.1 ZYRO0C07612p [Zygosaccharomyces rouxii]
MSNLKKRSSLSTTTSDSQTNLEVNQEQTTIKIEPVNTQKKLLYTWNEIPDWQKDNEHIVGGYVRETNSIRECLQSLLYLHNESINIYTHFLPGLCFLATCIFDKFAIKNFDTTTWIDYMAIDFFFFGAFSCLILSSTFHCFKSHSSRVSVFGNKLDYLGIVILIVCSMISILYYAFHDSNKLFYSFTLIIFCFGVSCTIASFDDTFRSREWRPYRAGLFVAFGLSALLPIMGGIIKYGFHETWTRIQMKWVILEGIFYIFGAFLYSIRFPERLAPGAFDFVGHSHQIFHVLVVIAALCHLVALMNSYELVHTNLLSNST